MGDDIIKEAKNATCRDCRFLLFEDVFEVADGANRKCQPGVVSYLTAWPRLNNRDIINLIKIAT
jgi:hypothetical protein